MSEKNNREIAIQLRGVKKRYKLGQIGGGTLQGDLQSWWARICGKDDPNTPIGTDQRLVGKTFMALNGVDLTIYKGEALGIIGANGAGKSTMLKLLSRVTAPSEGEIDIYGRIASMLEVGTGFNGEMTGRENIYMNGAILGMTKQEIDAKMDQIIEFSEVRDFIDTPVKRYSSGMYVKLAFSVAAHLDSEIMIMDEVLAVGDMAFQKKCLNKMREAAMQDGRTVLYVSHNMNTIRQLCDKCIVLDRGKIIFEGDVESAIVAYLGTGSNSQLEYDLEISPRPSNQHGQRIRIKRLLFCENEAPLFERNAPFVFCIEYTSFEEIYDLKLYYTVYSENGTIIGTAQTYKPFRNTKNGTTYRDIFKSDISNLSKGKYYFYIDLYSDDGVGNHWSYDHPQTPICFEVIDSNPEGINWQNYFGSIIMNSVTHIKGYE